MTTLSLAMIVKNEEGTLRSVLESVQGLCDELVVVDTGSADSTRQIARSLGASVHEFVWIDDFAAARNRSFELCSGDWILWLDADDVIPPHSVDKLIELKTTLSDEEVDAIGMPYGLAFEENGICAYSLYRHRLLRRVANLRWYHPVHEWIGVEPSQARSVHDIFIEHRPTAERLAMKEPLAYLRILERALRSGDRSNHTLFFYANELRGCGQYKEAIAAYEEFLEHAEQSWLIYYALKWISRCHCELNEIEPAFTCAVRASKHDPNRAEAFNDAGLILYSQRKFREAIPFFQKASTLSKPQDESPIEHCHYEWLPLDYLTSCHMALGQFSQARRFAQMAVYRNPVNGRLISNLVVLSKLSSTED